MAWEAGRGGSRGELAVPEGDPAALRWAAARFRRVANRALASASVSGTAAPELSLHWQGSAAATAVMELSQLSARAQRLLPGLDGAGLALTAYADALEHTQGRVRALRARADAARDEHARATAAAHGAGIEPLPAAQLLERADRELDQTMGAIYRSYGNSMDDFMVVSTRCARALARISAAAGAGRGIAAVRVDLLAGLHLAQDQIRAASTPPVDQVAEAEPGTWWEGALETAGDAAAWTYNHTAVPLVNGAANVLEAAAEHPEDVIEMALGAGMVVVGAGGEIAGVALDATGVGAVAGVPINIAAAGLVAAGAGAVTHGGSRLADHAALNQNRLLNEVDGPSVGGHRGNAGDPLPDSMRPDTAGANWKGRVANNDKGAVWQDPDSVNPPKGTPSDANSVRIMDPDKRYPKGYVRFYNEHGQPLTLEGRPGPKNDASTHIPRHSDGTYEIPRGWAP